MIGRRPVGHGPWKEKGGWEPSLVLGSHPLARVATILSYTSRSGRRRGVSDPEMYVSTNSPVSDGRVLIDAP